MLAVESWLYPADVYGNVFERLSAVWMADAICMAYNHAGNIHDNTFRNCNMGYNGMAICAPDRKQDRAKLVRDPL